jgi:hypothetical protein
LVGYDRSSFPLLTKLAQVQICGGDFAEVVRLNPEGHIAFCEQYARGEKRKQAKRTIKGIDA